MLGSSSVLGMKRGIVLVVALALAQTAPAFGDTLSLSVSPPSVPELEYTTLSIAATGNPSDEYWVSMPEESACPARPEQGVHEASGPLAELPRTVSIFAFFSGPNHLCGYLKANGEVIATAETSFTVTPSRKQVEEAEAVSSQEQREAERTAEAKAAAERPAREAAEWAAAETSAQMTAVSRLTVRVTAHAGRSSSHPGETVIKITTAAFANVTLRIRRHGHRVEHFTLSPRAVGEKYVTESVVVPWTCTRPGGTYQFSVTAQSDTGAALTRSGHFSPVSRARCQALKRREQAARERSARQYAEEVLAQLREEHAALERFEANCRQLGGTPVTLHTSEGNEKACRAPNGGRLAVPY
jgi:hypothetical protein